MKIFFFKELFQSFYQAFCFFLSKSLYLSWQHTYICSPLVSRDTEIWNYVYIWHPTALTRTHIGNYCSIASSVSIGRGEHDWQRFLRIAFFMKTSMILLKDPCIIGHDVWIGVDAIIRWWMTIGNGVVISANSFVNWDVPAYAIVVGSPAKIIRSRFTEDQIDLIEESRWRTTHDKKNSNTDHARSHKKIYA